MIFNAFISIRDDFDMGNTDPEAGPLSENAQFFAHAVDAKVVNTGWKMENQGGRDWAMWSVFFRDVVVMDSEIDALSSRNPGRTKVLAAWGFDGVPYLPPDGYAVYGNLLRYMPDVIDPADPEGPRIPATVLTDVNLLAGQTPRQF